MVRNCLIIAVVAALGIGAIVSLQYFEIQRPATDEELNDRRNATTGQSPSGESVDPFHEKLPINSSSDFVLEPAVQGLESRPVEEAARSTPRQDDLDTLAMEDTPPWPPGTEDRIYRAIAENSSGIKITGIHSVQCVGNLCTILLSVPDLHPTDTSEYSEIFSVLRNADLEIGSSSIAFVDHESGFRLIRLAIDNIEWSDERLKQIREAAAKSDKTPQKN